MTKNIMEEAARESVTPGGRRNHSMKSRPSCSTSSATSFVARTVDRAGVATATLSGGFLEVVALLEDVMASTELTAAEDRGRRQKKRLSQQHAQGPHAAP
mmetsp:Transcript_50346/g.90497  ORF Transcript_50346/g.90497 Transcript_50346/m.90497 type:complete len:100 (+) Transcript_50346:417-716(+)